MVALIKRMNWKRLAMLLLLCLLVFVCYFPVFSNGFLDSWDDQWMVMNTYTESGWSLENLFAIFTQLHKEQYSPLVELNYLLLYGLFGYDPFWFHLSSVVWHCGCVILLLFLTDRLLKMSEGVKSGSALKIVYISTSLFAVHPVNVESVAWLSAVKVPMYIFFIFWLCCFICVMSGCRKWVVMCLHFVVVFVLG